MPLEEIPLELILEFLSHLPSRCDLGNLALVSRAMHRRISPILHRTIEARALEQPPYRQGFQVVRDTFLSDGTRVPTNALETTAHLTFRAPIKEYRRKRCYNCDYSFSDVADDSHSSRGHRNTMRNLADDFDDDFPSLPQDALQTFSWHIGCCVPLSIVGSPGYLKSFQTQIHTVSLITDGTCHHPQKDYDGLLGLPNLQNISWKALGPVEHLESLQKLLHQKRHSLESIELEAAERLPEPLVARTSLLAQFTRSQKFTALEKLSLSAIGLRPGIRTVFLLEQLHSLTLIRCSYTLHLLRDWVQSSRGINLKSFEVAFDCESVMAGTLPVRALARFLESFAGLEELYIFIDKDVPIKLLTMVPFLHHLSTLKRLVYHERGDDRLTGWLLDALVSTPIRLECLGVSLKPSELTHLLRGPYPLERLELLHMRIMGRDYARQDFFAEAGPTRLPATPDPDLSLPSAILRLAHRLFAMTDLPTLAAFAVGDFSHGERFGFSQSWFRRHPHQPNANQPAERVSHAAPDNRRLEEIEGAREMIIACPGEQTVDCW